jgi:hypothetical protein
MEVRGQHLGLPQGVLGQGGIGIALGGRNERAIPERPYLRVTLAAHDPVDDDVPALVFFHGQARYDRVGNDPGCQDDGLRVDGLAMQVDRARLDGPHRGIGPDVGPEPAAEHADPIRRQIRIHLRHDAFPALEQDATHLVATHVRVHPRGRVHERSQLAEQLDPHQARADDHERQQRALALGVRFRVCALEALDQVGCAAAKRRRAS